MRRAWKPRTRFCLAPGLSLGAVVLAVTLAGDVRADADVAPVPLPDVGVEMFANASPGATAPSQAWCWQLLPDGTIYRSYLAGVQEPRFATTWVNNHEQGWLWNASLGGRVGLMRYGTQDARSPEGWQLDFEGVALPRLYREDGWSVMSTDYRVGVPLTYGRGRYQVKLGYYHLCSHLGDEFLLLNPGQRRLNYVRDSLVWGHSFYWSENVRLYAEVDYAAGIDGGAQPWHFQFGVDYSPATPSGLTGAPFLAVNSHLRQEVDYGGTFVLQTGWQWRGTGPGHLLRMGMEYSTGMSEQYEFYDRHEENLGLGVWYDF